MFQAGTGFFSRYSGIDTQDNKARQHRYVHIVRNKQINLFIRPILSEDSWEVYPIWRHVEKDPCVFLAVILKIKHPSWACFVFYSLKANNDQGLIKDKSTQRFKFSH